MVDGRRRVVRPPVQAPPDEPRPTSAPTAPAVTAEPAAAPFWSVVLRGPDGRRYPARMVTASLADPASFRAHLVGIARMEAPERAGEGENWIGDFELEVSEPGARSRRSRCAGRWDMNRTAVADVACADAERSGVEMSEVDGPWLDRGRQAAAVADDAGAVLRAWRARNGRTQGEVAALLDTTQQNLSQIEKGTRPVSLELRRKVVERGIAPEDLGLSSGQARSLIAGDNASPEIASSRMQWRTQRRWLNQNRRPRPARRRVLPPRVPGRASVADRRTGVAADEPIDMRAMRLTSTRARSWRMSTAPSPRRACPPAADRRCPLRALHLGHQAPRPPALFESRPSYRLLGVSLGDRRLDFGLAAYFDKLDVSEALGHEMAGAAWPTRRLSAIEQRPAGRLPFRDLIGDPFDPSRRAIIPAITTLTLRLRRYPAEPSFLLHWRDPAKVATAGGVYHVIPAGEFQPSSVALWDRTNDFDLWRNIVREYSEELLGEPEHDGTRTQPIDYEGWNHVHAFQGRTRHRQNATAKPANPGRQASGEPGFARAPGRGRGATVDRLRRGPVGVTGRAGLGDGDFWPRPACPSLDGGGFYACEGGQPVPCQT